MKVLVVEDEAPAAKFIRRGLRDEGYAVEVAKDAAEAEERVLLSDFDVILLDVVLPGASGLDLCRGWRERGMTTPILFLTARDEVEDRVQGLRCGGDDYLVKPFAFTELLARVEALLRRPRGLVPEVIRVADLEIDLGRRRVMREDVRVDLSTREFQLLEVLARAEGRVVSRSELWTHVWASGDEPDSNVIEVYVGYLRNKLGREPNLIETVRGAGYRLAVDGAR